MLPSRICASSMDPWQVQANNRAADSPPPAKWQAKEDVIVGLLGKVAGSCAGLAEYFRNSSTEEREHAEKLMVQQVLDQAPAACPQAFLTACFRQHVTTRSAECLLLRARRSRHHKVHALYTSFQGAQPDMPFIRLESLQWTPFRLCRTAVEGV